MGTRADFYIGKDEQAVWVASIGWDGYPSGIPKEVLDAKCREFFVAALAKFIAERKDVTLPKDGWPWPWNNSQTTDYAYAWRDGKVWASCFGSSWFDPLKPEPEYEELTPKAAIFPDMADRANVQLGGPKSGLIVIG